MCWTLCFLAFNTFGSNVPFKTNLCRKGHKLAWCDKLATSQVQSAMGRRRRLPAVTVRVGSFRHYGGIGSVGQPVWVSGCHDRCWWETGAWWPSRGWTPVIQWDCHHDIRFLPDCWEVKPTPAWRFSCGGIVSRNFFKTRCADWNMRAIISGVWWIHSEIDTSTIYIS